MLNINILLKKEISLKTGGFQFISGQECELAGPDIQIIEDAQLNIPKLHVKKSKADYYLGYNHPNPFSSVTKIEYGIAEPANVNLKIFNILGEEVSVLVNEFQEKGTYEVDFNANGSKYGTYFYRLETKDFNKTKKMILTE